MHTYGSTHIHTNRYQRQLATDPVKSTHICTRMLASEHTNKYLKEHDDDDNSYKPLACHTIIEHPSTQHAHDRNSPLCVTLSTGLATHNFQLRNIDRLYPVAISVTVCMFASVTIPRRSHQTWLMAHNIKMKKN